MKKNTITILVVVAIVALALYFYIKSQADKKPIETIPAPASAPEKEQTKKSTSTSSTGIDRYKSLQLGSKGEEVKVIQKFLRPYSLNKIVVDGIFGKGTEAWLKTYKLNNKYTSNPVVTSIYELNADGKSKPFGI